MPEGKRQEQQDVEIRISRHDGSTTAEESLFVETISIRSDSSVRRKARSVVQAVPKADTGPQMELARKCVTIGAGDSSLKPIAIHQAIQAHAYDNNIDLLM